MSQLLKLTKKSCLKIFRKIAPLKPTSAQKLEEEDEISNDQHGVTSSYEEASASIPQNPLENELYTKSHNLNEIKTVQDCETSSAYEAEVENSSPTDLENTKIFQCLTSRLFSVSDGYEFQRLQQLRSDTVSEIVAYEPEFATSEIVFEKVKYNKHVRYFRRTPSCLSLDDVDDRVYNESIRCADPLAELPKRAHSAAAARQLCYNDSSNHQPSTVQSIPQNIPVYVPMNVMSLEIKNPGKFESVVIAEQRDRFDKMMPIVKWDINGNSLDDDFYVGGSWNESMDLNWNGSVEKPISQFKLDIESQKSSFRSSSTTLETWLEEDLLGSSLNERRQFAANLFRPKV
ncbi:uncharacterized protein LOC129244838 [Anastrepha obliqua]|uniref:uncharacterized protein LOC129244838 n=1 Tax=Anastrepha obliqua TaxID=95512 RepID=UPI002409EDE4|nr:uncharacterized protein LOC129244838 [Anastrepha obliqua]